MQYLQHQLNNGLQILVEQNPRAHSMACGFFVRTGSRDETHEIGGVSHFLEHMVFKGTPHRTAEQVNLELDEMGSHSNARTGEESTIYHAAVLSEFQTPIIELLSDIMRPSLRNEDFEMEKKVIIEEIMMYDDQPPYGGHEKIMADYFGQHPLCQSVLGTVDTVGALTPQQMLTYFEQRYSPNNMALAVAGNVDFDLLVADVERCCGAWKRFETERHCPSFCPSTGFSSLGNADSTQQYLIQLAPGPSASDEDRFATRVLTTILGDDGGSRIYWEFVDSGLAEAAGIGNYEYDGAGVIMSFLCCAPEDAQGNLERLVRIQKEALTQPITRHELELAKSKIASHIILASERTESRMFSVGAQWLKKQAFMAPSQIAQLYEAVTLEQVQEAAQRYPLFVNRTLSVGPATNLVEPV